MGKKKKLKAELILEVAQLQKRVAELEALSADPKQTLGNSHTESEINFYHVFEYANTGMCLVDHGGRLVKVNQAMSDIFGYTIEELEGITVNDIAHPDDTDISPTFIKKASNGEIEQSTFGKRYFHKQGHLIWCQVSSRVVRDQHGSPRFFISNVIDVTERVKVNDALREGEARLAESNQLLSGVLEHTYMMAVFLDTQFNFIWVNRTYADTCGYEPSFFPGKNHFDLYPHEENQAIFQNVVDTGEPFFIEAKPFEFPDQPERGVTFWDWSLFPVNSDTGNVTGLVFTLADVTERVKAEDATRLHAAMLDNVAEGIYLVGWDDLIIKWTNEKIEQMFGYDPDEMIGKQVDTVNAPTESTPSQTRSSIVDALDETGEWHGEVRNIRRDGTHFWCYANVSLFDHPDHGRVMLAVHTDITERKRTETELEEIFNLSPDMVAVCTTEGKFLKVNPSWERVLGFTQKELLNLGWADLVHPDDVEETNKVVEKQLEGGNVVNFINRYRCKDGSHKTFEWQATYANEGIVHATARDITENKLAEEALKQYSENLEEMVEERTRELHESQAQLIRQEKLAALGQLGGGVAHELRNPLGVISNAVYFLKSSLADTDDVTVEYLDMMSSEIGGAIQIIENLLSLTRKEEPKTEKILVAELIADGFVRQVPPEGVKASTKIADETLTALVDPSQIGQVLENLMSNAYQAMPEGGELTVRAWEEDSDVLISVTDTGCGIPEENLHDIFEPLFTTKPRGIGLGLAISRDLADANKGSVEVESVVDQGTTFTLTLPGV